MLKGLRHSTRLLLRHTTRTNPVRGEGIAVDTKR